MIYKEPMENSYNFLWDLTSQICNNGTPRWLMGACIYRVYRKHKRRFRVILSAPYNSEAGQLFLDGHKIKYMSVRHVPCGQIDNPQAGTEVMTMDGCELSRQWIPRVSPAKLGEADSLKVWIELMCYMSFNQPEEAKWGG